MKKIFQYKIPIQKKLFISYIALVLVFTFVISSIIFYKSQSIIERQVSETKLKLLAQIVDKFDMVINNMISVTNIYMLNNHVRNVLVHSNKLSPYDMHINKKEITGLFETNSNSFQEIQYYTSILGYNKEELHSNDRHKIYMQDLRAKNWFKELLESDGRIYWTLFDGKGNNAKLLSAVRMLKDFHKGNVIGILCLSVDEKYIKNTYIHSLNEYEKIFIINEEGRIISSNIDHYIGKAIDGEAYREKISKYFRGYAPIEFEGVRGLLTFNTIQKNNWKIAAFTPSHMHLTEVHKLKIVVTAIMISFLFIGLLTAYVFSKQFSRSIRVLSNDIQKIQNGDLSIRTKVNSNDEIGMIAEEFNIMVEQIELLMDDIHHSYEQKRKAEIQALQSQINPHFLHNTLAAIRGMNMMGQKKSVDSAIVALVKVLKQSLSTEREIITVRQEVENLKNYLIIQRLRYGNDLEIEYNIQEDILECNIIKLILQPIVENAIFHGIQPKASGGTIVINGYKEESNLIFEIIDDGVGMSEENIQKMNSGQMDYDSVNHGIGLKNTKDRVNLYYGAQYEVFVYNNDGEGVTVKISVPVIKGEHA